MQDLDDGVRVGRGRLSAVVGDATTKVQPFLDEGAVVPGHRLLDVASALSEGASLMHARLRHLEADERDAILDLMAGQLSTIVHLWTDLVRDVVPGVSAPVQDAPVPGPSVQGAPVQGAPFEDPPIEGAPVEPEQVEQSAQAHPSAQGHGGATVNRPLGEARRRDDGAPGDAGSDPQPGREPDGGVRRLARRPAETLRRDGDVERRQADTVNRELWATPLRSVKVDESDNDYEGDRLTRDELTGVLNRQAGFAALGRELDRCRRAGERFVLGYLNVDGLKDVNSHAGLRGGDELLRKVTAALRATLRSYDVIMRLGGDEFLFSLPGADMTTAELRANEFGVILAEEAPGASASVGFGELRGNDTLDEIISRAEVELVRSRRSRVRSR
jgi:diguanylate cyclase (GGDEF)-like protein